MHKTDTRLLTVLHHNDIPCTSHTHSQCTTIPDGMQTHSTNLLSTYSNLSVVLHSYLLLLLLLLLLSSIGVYDVVVVHYLLRALTAPLP
jgi:hypothetical protein